MFSKNNSENLSTLANLLQIASFLLLINETSNDKLLEELHDQDERYLEKALKQNEEIIARLERIENARTINKS